MHWRRAKALLIGLAFGGIPLVTFGTCNPATGTFDFYRDDDHHHDVWDVIVDDGYYYDVFCYDDYYDDDCFLCF